MQLHKIQFNLHVSRILEIGLNNLKIWKKNWRVLLHIASQQFLLTFVPDKKRSEISDKEELKLDS